MQEDGRTLSSACWNRRWGTRYFPCNPNLFLQTCNSQQTLSEMPTVYQALLWALGIQTQSYLCLPPRSSTASKQIITKQPDKSNDHIVEGGGRGPDLGSGASRQASWSPGIRAKCFGGSHLLPPRLILPLCPRGACLWRPWLSSTSDPSSQVWRLVDSVSLSRCVPRSHAQAATCVHSGQAGPFPERPCLWVRAADVGMPLHGLPHI